MKRLMASALFLTLGAGSLLVVVSCTTQSSKSPTFPTQIETVVGLNPTLTYTATNTFTFYFTPTNTATITNTSTPYVTATWPGVILPFNHPSGVAVDPSGNIYVADTGNNRVEKYAPNGTLVSNWGNYGRGKGILPVPSPVAVAVGPATQLYVASSSLGAVIVYDHNGNYETQFTSAAGTAFSNPQGVVVDGAGNIYISDTGNNRLVQLTSAGVTTGFGGSDGIISLVAPVTIASGVTVTSPVTLAGIAIDVSAGTTILYASTKGTGINSSPYSTVLSFNTASGTPAAVIPGFTNPNGLAFDGNGNLYATDSSVSGTNGVIDVFTAGNFISPSEPYLGNGILVDPKGVAVDPFGNIYVADYSAGNGGNGSVILLAP